MSGNSMTIDVISFGDDPQTKTKELVESIKRKVKKEDTRSVVEDVFKNSPSRISKQVVENTTKSSRVLDYNVLALIEKENLMREKEMVSNFIKSQESKKRSFEKEISLLSSSLGQELNQFKDNLKMELDSLVEGFPNNFTVNNSSLNEMDEKTKKEDQIEFIEKDDSFIEMDPTESDDSFTIKKDLNRSSDKLTHDIIDI